MKKTVNNTSSQSKPYIAWNILIGVLSLGIFHGIYYVVRFFVERRSQLKLDKDPILFFVKKYQAWREEKAKQHSDSESFEETDAHRSSESDEKEELRDTKKSYAKPFKKAKTDYRQIDHDIYLAVKKYNALDEQQDLRIDIIPDLYFEKDSLMNYCIDLWAGRSLYDDFYKLLEKRGEKIKARLLKKYPTLQEDDIVFVHAKTEDPRRGGFSLIPDHLKHRHGGENHENLWFNHCYIEIKSNRIPNNLLKANSPFNDEIQGLYMVDHNGYKLALSDDYCKHLLAIAIEEYKAKGNKGELIIKLILDSQVSRIDFHAFFYFCRELNLNGRRWTGDDFAQDFFFKLYFPSFLSHLKTLDVSDDDVSIDKSKYDTRFPRQDFRPDTGRDSPQVPGSDYCPKLYTIKLKEDAAHALIEKFEMQNLDKSSSLSNF